MRGKFVSGGIFFYSGVLALSASGHLKPWRPWSPLSKEQAVEARKIAGPRVRNCGTFTIQPSGYEDINTGTFRLNACAISALKRKKPFLLTYRSARQDGFPAWCLIGTGRGRISTLGFPVHDDFWDRLRKLPCERYEIVTIKGIKYLQTQ